MELIDKSALIAEIENLLDKGKYHDDYDCAFRDGNNAALYALKGRINTLEVKEVDLEKLLEDYGIDTDPFSTQVVSSNGAKIIAKHFFELGMQQSKNYNNNKEKK